MMPMCEFSKEKSFSFAEEKLDDLQRRLDDANVRILEGEKLRKELHNTVMELKGNIRVLCRVRPLLSDDGAEIDTVVSFPTSLESQGRAIELTQNGRKHQFTFDRVFVPDASQVEVFLEISHLVQSALDGYKVCLFAYGQTGSGMTYTMMGKLGIADQKGVIPRALDQVFETRQILQAQGWKYKMQVSMLEIYNKTIKDLLAPESAKKLEIKTDSDGNAHVPGLTVLNIHSSEEVLFHLERANERRSVGKTKMNEESSRSHFMFTIHILGVNERTDQQVKGALNLTDLAGSESLSKSGSTGDTQMKETVAINSSLSSLGDVISALANKELHVPYRNSKLTHLLQPYLGGRDAKTLMFVNISPDPSSVGESFKSLQFATRVNACGPRRA